MSAFQSGTVPEMEVADRSMNRAAAKLPCSDQFAGSEPGPAMQGSALCDQGRSTELLQGQALAAQAEAVQLGPCQLIGMHAADVHEQEHGKG